MLLIFTSAAVLCTFICRTIVNRAKHNLLTDKEYAYDGNAGLKQDQSHTMTTRHFKIKEHTLSASHIREYPRSLASDDQEDTLQIAIKQYLPKDQKQPDGGDVTLIGAHANGFPKEMYEPLWDDLYESLKAQGIKICNIWIADVAHQGRSGVINEHKLGNDPSWLDHPRDLFLMVNHFSKHMKRPIVGIGHSMGGNNLVNLSSMHARLFESLILIDPVIQEKPSALGNLLPARASTKRRDRWPSRKVAKESFAKSPFYQAWDSRVLDKWLEYGLRELPTAVYPLAQSANILPVVSAESSSASINSEKDSEREVTLQTTKHQEVMSFLRSNFPTPEYPSPNTEPNPLTHPDVDTAAGSSSPFYRPEPLSTFAKLPNLRPSVLYVFGEKSNFSSGTLRQDKVNATGVGVGGSGGAAKGRVKDVTIEGVGHLIPMEAVTKTAQTISGWLEPELQRFRKIEEAERAEWKHVPREKRNQLSPQYVEMMMGDWINSTNTEHDGKAKL